MNQPLAIPEQPVTLAEPQPRDFLLQLAMRADVDAAKVSALADVYVRLQEQKRAWDRADRAEAARLEYLSDKALMQAELPVLDKTTPNQEGKGKFVDFGELWEACFPIWTAHGFAVSYDIVPTDNGLIRLKLLLDHRGGHREEYFAPDTPPDTTGPRGTPNKTIPQGNQSTITYVQRGLLTRALGIAMKREDDDGNSGHVADRPPPDRPPPRPRPSKPAAQGKPTIGQWLDSFGDELDGCQWSQDLDNLMGRPDVQQAKATFVNGARIRLDGMIRGAYDRVRAHEREIRGDA